MKILGISAVTQVLSVALIEDNQLLGEKTVVKDQARSEHLILFIDELFQELKFDKKNLDGVAVTEGPGSYSGIRGSLATAKTLAQALKIPVVGVSTLEAMACSADAKEVFVILDACRNELNIAGFRRVDNGFERLKKDQIYKTEDVLAMLKTVAPETGIVFSERAQKEIPNLEGIKTDPKALNVAFLGLKQFKNGNKGNLSDLQPKYSHTPNIRTFSGDKK